MAYLVPDLQIIDEKNNNLSDLQFCSEFCFCYEEEIKKSRFITSLGRANNRDSAKNFIDMVKKKYHDATHNCYAFALGPPKDTANIGQSDDGEPYGTAGKPMLNMLLHGEIGECVVVVTRYFGGIKLGQGGLVRAYQGMVGNALNLVKTCEKISYEELKLICNYDAINKIYHLMPQYDAKIINESYNEQIEFTFSIPSTFLLDFQTELQNACAGNIIFQ